MMSGGDYKQLMLYTHSVVHTDYIIIANLKKKTFNVYI